MVSRPGPTSDWVINHSKITCSGRKDYIDNVVFPSGFVFLSVVCLRFCFKSFKAVPVGSLDLKKRPVQEVTG